MNLKLSYSALLFISFFTDSCPCSIEKLVKQTVENEMKNAIVLKKQLTDMDERQSEIFRSVNDTVVSKISDTKEYAKSDSGVNKTDTKNNCSCHKSAQSKIRTTMPESEMPSPKQNLKNDLQYDNDSTEKIQIVRAHDYEKVKCDENDHCNKTTDSKKRTTGKQDSSNSTENQQPVKSTPVPTPTTEVDVVGLLLTAPFNAEIIKAQDDVKEIEFQIESAIRELCPSYKEVPELDIQSMADVWQLAYYRAEEPLSCFKILLKKIATQSRKRYETKYFNFNGSIVWDECHLELSSAGRQEHGGKHFLQGTKSNKGILDNIVISKIDEDDNIIFTMEEQTPNQWLVTKDLLLMRDCDSGDVGIFTRLLAKPTWRQVQETMTLFGEDGLKGAVACDSNNDDKSSQDDLFRNKKYHILS